MTEELRELAKRDETLQPIKSPFFPELRAVE